MSTHNMYSWKYLIDALSRAMLGIQKSNKLLNIYCSFRNAKDVNNIVRFLVDKIQEAKI